MSIKRGKHLQPTRPTKLFDHHYRGMTMLRRKADLYSTCEVIEVTHLEDEKIDPLFSLEKEKDMIDR